mmetsp:Transcript_36078/g.55393  ORF Transcript_36078/g.55393 Transcript_36078/m.55393 type:complete len:257 (+) Transcript_36078:1037-1807(+)
MTYADIDFETDPLFPRLDITKYVAMTGDYYTKAEEGENKTVTTFRMHADYETMVKTAHYYTVEYFHTLEGLVKNGQDTDSFVEETCDVYADLGTDFEQREVSTATLAALYEDYETDLETALLIIAAKYPEINQEYLDEANAKTTELLTAYKKSVAAAHNEALFPTITYFNKELPSDKIADLVADLKKCYTVTVTSSSISLTDYMFQTKFEEFLTAYVDLVNTNMGSNNTFVDSMQLFIKQKNQKWPQLIFEDNHVH